MDFLQKYKDVEFKEGRDVSVIVVTHDVHLSVRYADEIFILKNGKLNSQIIREDGGWSDGNEGIENIFEYIVDELN